MTHSGPIPVREGDLLAGKYRVEKVLGSGGMGIVVAARHEQLDQRVAIKFVREEALGNEEAVERFLREARAAVKLKSEHAAKVLDVGTLESGAPYMVMEYLEGSDLAQVIVERGVASAETAADWVVQACEAVAEAHAAGIVHRDLKPQNLFLARTVGGAAKVKVLDFGVSKSIAPTSGGSGGLTRTRSMLGSPLYMSPEQMRSSRDVDARSDVWALGVVLFELLTQRWPFEADTMPELCLKVVTDPPQSLPELRPDLPATMLEVVDRCLQKNPAHRFANAAELATALEPLASPASRVIVERARLAMAASGQVTRPGEDRVVSGGGTLQSAATPARTAPTPAAWGSGKKAVATASEAKKRPPLVWVAVGAAVTVGGVVAAFALRGTSSGGAPAAASSPAVAAPAESPVKAAAPAATPEASAPGAATLLAAAPVAAPPASALAAAGSALPSSAPAPSSAPPSAPLASAASAVRAAAAKPTAPPRVPPPGKPAARDDDIPSLR